MSGQMRDFLRQASANAVGSVTALLIAGLVSGFIRPHWAEVVLVVSVFPIAILSFRGVRWLWRRATARLYPIERADLAHRLISIVLLIALVAPVFMAIDVVRSHHPVLVVLPITGVVPSLILLRRGIALYVVRTPDGMRLRFGPYSPEHEEQLRAAWRARQEAKHERSNRDHRTPPT
jgi:hypothetical protein